MVIHNLQAEFRLLIALAYTRDSEDIVIFAQLPRLFGEIFIHVCVCTIPAFGSVRFPQCQ